ncbi:hypothetical protein ACJJTC_001139 [Scirpophaga incertulas]
MKSDPGCLVVVLRARHRPPRPRNLASDLQEAILSPRSKVETQRSRYIAARVPRRSETRHCSAALVSLSMDYALDRGAGILLSQSFDMLTARRISCVEHGGFKHGCLDRSHTYGPQRSGYVPFQNQGFDQHQRHGQSQGAGRGRSDYGQDRSGYNQNRSGYSQDRSGYSQNRSGYGTQDRPGNSKNYQSQWSSNQGQGYQQSRYNHSGQGYSSSEGRQGPYHRSQQNQRGSWR